MTAVADRRCIHCLVRVIDHPWSRCAVAVPMHVVPDPTDPPASAMGPLAARQPEAPQENA